MLHLPLALAASTLAQPVTTEKRCFCRCEDNAIVVSINVVGRSGDGVPAKLGSRYRLRMRARCGGRADRAVTFGHSTQRPARRWVCSGQQPHWHKRGQR